jgi:hypothetical protein
VIIFVSLVVITIITNLKHFNMATIKTSKSNRYGKSVLIGNIEVKFNVDGESAVNDTDVESLLSKDPSLSLLSSGSGSGSSPSPDDLLRDDLMSLTVAELKAMAEKAGYDKGEFSKIKSKAKFIDYIILKK